MGIKNYFEIIPSGSTPGAESAREIISRLSGRDPGPVSMRRVYLITGSISESDRRRIASELLCDPVLERCVLEEEPLNGCPSVTVSFRPGVMDQEAETLIEALGIMGVEGAEKASALKKYVFADTADRDELTGISPRALYNPLIEEAVVR